LSSPRSRKKNEIKGCVFNIERFAIRDGPGIRTTVFFKGCPLRCLWCSNPESFQPSPQLFYFEHLCQQCYRCVDACPNKATSVNPEGGIEIARNLCKACGKCVEVCPTKARDISGMIMTVDEVMEEVKKDMLFYQNSGGGVTASGGEPTHQPEFLQRLFERCHESAIHTCLDTCGFVKSKVLQKILAYTDLVLYDIKHMDPVQHKKLTGVDNGIILENARMIATQGKPMIVRVPLIPRHNDSEQNIKALAGFMADLKLKKIDLLPYHALGKAKYERLGLEYKLSKLKPHKSKEIEAIKTALESYGLEVGVG